MIVKLKNQEFDKVFSIMEQSFPIEEYRSGEAQKALLGDPAYAIWAAKEQGNILGFAAVWELDGWLFLEHLAVAPEHRNRGIGAQLLRFFAGKRCCLEVELPESPISCRRIGFYQRNGFYLNGYPYVQPSLGEGRSPVPLRIMTSGGTIQEEEFAKLKALLYARVYGQR